MFCAYTRPRYQDSVYKTIGPLVSVYTASCVCELTENRRNCFTSVARVYSTVGVESPIPKDLGADCYQCHQL